MIYKRMPVLEAEERLIRLPTLDLSAVQIAPGEVARNLGLPPQGLRIGMLGDRPVYRFARGQPVFADTGEPTKALTADEAIQLVGRFVPEHAETLAYDAFLTEPDQWTLQSRGLLPLHRISLGDPEVTRLYVSERTGEVVMKTTRSGRRWGYLGAVLHWLYFTPFRVHSTLWAQTVIWLSVVGCLLTLSGLIWGVWRYSPRGRHRSGGESSRSPYTGLMRWHHYAGLIFGLFSFTFVLSGGLSMDPWSWHPSTSPTRQQRQAVRGGPLQLDSLTVARLRQGAAALVAASPTKELQFTQFRGELFLVAIRSGAAEPRLVSVVAPEKGAFTRFEDNAMLEAARAAMPDVAVEDVVWLDEYDSYYYQRDGGRPLPVLRVRYRDPQRTWLYLDPRRGAVVQKEERLTRLNRWLYHGLHSLDFPFLYDRRLMWNIVMIVLSVGGIVLSASTLLPGWRRLRHHGGRLRRGLDSDE